MFQHNHQIRIIQRPTAPQEDAALIGRLGRFIEYTPKGYARVFLNEHDDVLVHPENLERAHQITCVVDDCGFYANDESDFCPMHY